MTEILARRFDAALLDLDGTIYEGDAPVPGARPALERAGLPMAFITNNASRAPQTVADQLTGLGYDCSASDVITSAQAAVEMAAEVIEPGSKVLILGAQPFRDLAEEAGFTVVESADDAPAAVLHGLDREMTWARLCEGALAVTRGAVYLASNMDTTLPTERGLLVGNGSMIAAITSTTGVVPRSAGKPEPAMFLRAADRLGATRPVAIGDRLDTDIRGGNVAGMPTLMVVTGVSGHREALSAPAQDRPALVGADMSALLAPAAHAEPAPQAGFTARRDPADASVVVLSGGDESDPRLADPAQAAVAAMLTCASVVWDDGAAEVRDVRAESAPAAAAVAAWR